MRPLSGPPIRLWHVRLRCVAPVPFRFVLFCFVLLLPSLARLGAAATGIRGERTAPRRRENKQTNERASGTSGRPTANWRPIINGFGQLCASAGHLSRAVSHSFSLSARPTASRQPEDLHPASGVSNWEADKLASKSPAGSVSPALSGDDWRTSCARSARLVSLASDRAGRA